MKYAICLEGIEGWNKYKAFPIIQEFPEYKKILVKTAHASEINILNVGDQIKIIEVDFELTDSDREDIKILCLIDEDQKEVDLLNSKLDCVNRRLKEMTNEELKILNKGLKW